MLKVAHLQKRYYYKMSEIKIPTPQPQKELTLRKNTLDIRSHVPYHLSFPTSSGMLRVAPSFKNYYY